MFEPLSLLILSLAPVLAYLAGGVIFGLFGSMLKILSLPLSTPQPK
jgi:hypothetical protein